MSCPASDSEPAVVARVALSYTPIAFEGTGSLDIQPKEGPGQRATSVLSGRRVGECP
jgi:hypothetical protein